MPNININSRLPPSFPSPFLLSPQFKRKKATYIAPTAQRMVQDTLPLLGYCDVAFPYWFHALCGSLTAIYWDVGGSVMAAMRRNRVRILEQAAKKKGNGSGAGEKRE